jgi:hypothetical protein
MYANYEFERITGNETRFRGLTGNEHQEPVLHRAYSCRKDVARSCDDINVVIYCISPTVIRIASFVTCGKKMRPLQNDKLLSFS